MKIIKGYKGFNKGLVCNGFKYEVGKEYKYKGEIKICEKGFHFCENPLDVLNYYDLCDSEFAEVETDGKLEKDNDKDTKICSDKIKINAKLDLSAFIKVSFDFLWTKCNDKKDDNVQASSGNSSKLASSGYSSQLASSGYSSKLASSGNSSQLASSGNSSKLASSGNYSQLASSGNSSKLASSGDYSQLASSGNYSQLASSGNSSQLASSGYSSKLASSGDYSKLASSGYSSKLASSGYSSKLEINGNNSVGANIGVNGKIKGKKGCWITLAEYDDKYNPICVKSVIIDGKKIKENTWYELKNKHFIEVK